MFLGKSESLGQAEDIFFANEKVIINRTLSVIGVWIIAFVIFIQKRTYVEFQRSEITKQAYVDASGDGYWDWKIKDDYDINLEVFSEYLEEIGVSSETANSPHDALEKIEKAYKLGKPYDVILIDYIMPKINGEMMGHTIKENQEKFGTPKLIMLTAMGKKDDFSGIDQAGFLYHLVKPIYPHILIDTIIKVLYAEASEDEIQATEENVKESIRHDSIPQFNADILIVEDFQPNQEVVAAIVEKLGCKFDIASDGQDAIDILERSSNKYKIVLMDCQMPHLDGFDATRKLRKKKWGKDLTVIAMTANALQGDKEKCLTAGMNDYISKPIKMTGLQKIFEKYLLETKTG